MSSRSFNNFIGRIFPRIGFPHFSTPLHFLGFFTCRFFVSPTSVSLSNLLLLELDTVFLASELADLCFLPDMDDPDGFVHVSLINLLLFELESVFFELDLRFFLDMDEMESTILGGVGVRVEISTLRR